MTQNSFESPNADDVSTLSQAAANALFGLAVRAWMQEGAQSAEACLSALAAGRLHLECKAVFSRQGFALEIDHCSHGNRQNLASLTLKSAPASGANGSVH